MKKLILFGDSLFGQLGKQRIIKMEAVLQDYDVYNCAAGGWDTNDCAKKAPYLSKLRPDVIVISLGTNDCAPWKLVPIDKFLENLPRIFSAFSSSRIVYFLPPPVDERKSDAFGKDFSNKNVQAYYDAAKKLCQNNKIDFIDSFAVFMPLLESKQEYHLEDGVHLNDFAYETISKELAKILV